MIIENQPYLFNLPDKAHYLNCACMSPSLDSAVEAYGPHLNSIQPWRINELPGVRLPEYLPGDLLQPLAGEGVSISKRGHSLRFAPRLYNNERDAECLWALDSHVETGTRGCRVGAR